MSIAEVGHAPDHAEEPNGLFAAVDALAASPLHAMSLSSRELFYSNLLAWAAENYPRPMTRVLGTWLRSDGSNEGLRVRREWKHTDVLIELPGYQPLVIENKSLAMPDEAQLARYDAILQQAVGKKELRAPTRVLLSPVSPGWAHDRFQTPVGGVWHWVSYAELGTRLTEAFEAGPKGYGGDTMRHLASLLIRLQAVLNSDAARPSTDDPLLLDPSAALLLQKARVHHLVVKARAYLVGNLIRQRLRDEGYGDTISVVTNMTRGTTLIDGIPTDPQSGLPSTGDRFQWQIQGYDLRLAVVYPSLEGSSEEKRNQRIAAARALGSWFDFGPAREVLGARCGAESAAWLRFDPDFVYRKVAIKGATVGEVVGLAVRYSKRLMEAEVQDPSATPSSAS